MKFVEKNLLIYAKKRIFAPYIIKKNENYE
jgi:hypothetical protein